jgi:hypothetical protein
LESILSIADGGGHGDNKVWGCTGARAQETKTTGIKVELAYKDGIGRYRCQVEEG